MLTYERLKELLEYDPNTGLFYWRFSRRGVKAGSQAGYLDEKGYVRITLDRIAYKAHRLAWLYIHGEWPAGDIDHVLGDRSDNRIDKLRDASRSINIQNQRSAHKRNKLGILGVIEINGKYRATIMIDGKNKTIGTYDTPEEASEAYLDAKRKHHQGSTI